jgi:hypothetical protein
MHSPAPRRLRCHRPHHLNQRSTAAMLQRTEGRHNATAPPG